MKLQQISILAGMLMLGIVPAGFSFQRKAANHQPAHAGTAKPDVAMKMLVEGNRRFMRNHPVHPDQSPARRLNLAAKGQRPFAIVLSCSDSRVPPEVVFDAGLGDLFVIRIAGNVVNDDVIASIEYAAEHLGAKLLMVLGHEGCGAVSAAVANNREGHLGSLSDAIQPAVRKVLGDSLIPAELNARTSLTNKAVRANVELVIERLSRSEPVLSNLISSHELRIAGAYYHLGSGKVEFTNHREAR